jgi:hypothetical protein
VLPGTTPSARPRTIPHGPQILGINLLWGAVLRYVKAAAHPVTFPALRTYRWA